jgi:4-amino-4-deoxy-L-arabinose transferase-like glycosyltransferase
MVSLAFAVRILYIAIAHTYAFKTHDDNFSFGFEMGRIGRSLAEGQGFGNPFNGVTGPTAWEPPLYPMLIAGVFKLFGIYTHASAFVLLTVNSLFAAMTCVPIFRIAKRCFHETAAVWSAWAFALLPSMIFWATRWIWETSISAFLLACIFWLTLTLEERNGLRPWLEFGGLWGITALVNASLLSFLPVSGVWAWYRRARARKRSIPGVMLSAAMFLLCLSPWVVRNYDAFGAFIPTRSNFGEELRLGNGPGADGKWMDSLHPTKDAEQLQLYRQMGEIAYVAERKREALVFIREDWGRFAKLCAKRFAYYWGGPSHERASLSSLSANFLYLASSLLAVLGLGQAMRKRRPGAGLFLWLVIAYPLVYYTTFFLPRYRHPIEPELLILIVYFISEVPSFRWAASSYE